MSILSNKEIHRARREGRLGLYPPPEASFEQLLEWQCEGTLHDRTRPFPERVMVNLPNGARPGEKPAYDNTTIRFRLGTSFRVQPYPASEDDVIDIHHGANIFAEMAKWPETVVGLGETFLLKPWVPVAATTLEWLHIPVLKSKGDGTPPRQLVGRLVGRTTVARTWLLLHATADVMNAGNDNVVTLELINLGRKPIPLVPGMPIAALELHEVYGEIEEYVHTTAGLVSACQHVPASGHRPV